jgi:hypothetical protein
MTKTELITSIKDLIHPDTTPQDLSDGEVLDIIYDILLEEEELDKPKSSVTPWFTDQQPYRGGVYEVAPFGVQFPTTYYAAWNGSVWSFFDDTIEGVVRDMANDFATRRVHHSLIWRGLIQEQS